MKLKSTRKPFFVAVLILANLFSPPTGIARAEDKDAPFQKVVTIEGITEYHLAGNGVRFLALSG